MGNSQLVVDAKEVEMAMEAYAKAKAAEAQADADLKNANKDVKAANHDVHQAEQEDAGTEVIKELRAKLRKAIQRQAAAQEGHETAELALAAATKLVQHALSDLFQDLMKLPLFGK
ncbi:MAG: hypothetical protein QOF19_2511 [Alphaproteobacteria bacterium]|jgi:hypothetical protein|nr:hypothetical protein [Alphaproteobacteria bacterium]